MYQQINLYQPIFRRQRQVFSARTLLAGLGVVGAAMLAIYAYGYWQVLELEAEVLQLEERQEAYRAQFARLDPASSADRHAQLDLELRRLNEQLSHQQQLTRILREQSLGSTEGFSPELAALARQHTSGLWLTRVAIQGGSERMELAGISVRPDLVPEYLQRLGTEPALNGQRFDLLTIERMDGETTVSFRVSSRELAAAFARESR